MSLPRFRGLQAEAPAPHFAPEGAKAFSDKPETPWAGHELKHRAGGHPLAASYVRVMAASPALISGC
jgi:hypothetical protein